jgi:hypothetical protein
MLRVDLVPPTNALLLQYAPRATLMLDHLQAVVLALLVVLELPEVEQ